MSDFHLSVSPAEAAPVSVAAAAASCTAVLLLTRALIKYLSARGMTVEDAHKPGRPQVPRPGGPAILLAIVIGEVIIFALLGSVDALAVALATTVAGLIGLIDDLRTLGGVVKPVLLILAAAPILLLGAYDFHLALPLFGGVRLPIVYPLLVLIAIPVTANTVNSIDVFNGVASGFTGIALVPLLLAFTLKGDGEALASAIPVAAVIVTFMWYHKYPSKIFPGDSGSLALGAAYGSLAITGGVEVVAIVAILPAILNSFFFLSSVRRFAEHRDIKVRPVILLENFKLAPSRDESAPITLVRLILAEGPLSEREIVAEILKLTAVSALLAFGTTVLTWVVQLV